MTRLDGVKFENGKISVAQKKTGNKLRLNQKKWCVLFLWETSVDVIHSLIGCEYRSAHCVSSACISVMSHCALKMGKSFPVTNAFCALGWVRSNVLFHTCVHCRRLYSEWFRYHIKSDLNENKAVSVGSVVLTILLMKHWKCL